MYEFKFLIFEMEERTEYQGMEESIAKNVRIQTSSPI
jgi:hypothetical protein